MEITRYELEQDAGERCRFSMHETLMAGAGSAGSLLPPHEYHTIRNPNEKAIAISLHIYQSEMACCARFQPQSGEWFLREAATLATDQAA